MVNRKIQLRELYGVDFPPELFTFWEWYSGRTPEQSRQFGELVGMSLVGVFDVLAGRFDGVELRYPAVLHWRFTLDPPEFFTVFCGDTDGLHWGYWFDDPGRCPPVVAAWYARDAFELWTAGETLMGAVRNQIDRVEQGLRENIEYDPDNADEYQSQLKVLPAFRESLPRTRIASRRTPTAKTPDGMGIVVPKKQTAGGNRLRAGKELWAKGDPRAFAVLEEAYIELDREPLAAVVRAHRAHPHLPYVDILQFRPGDYHSFAEALAAPENVRRLEIGAEGLKSIPDLSPLSNLEELSLWGNALADLPDTLAACKRLRAVNLTGNRLKSIPAVLLVLPRLNELRLGKNALKSLGKDVGKLNRLKELQLFGNPMSSSEVTRIRKLLPKTDVIF